MKTNMLTEAKNNHNLTVGTRTQLGSYTISKDEIIAFATQWDPLFFHTNEQRAINDGYFGGLIASGVHTIGILQRLSVKGVFQYLDVIGGAGIQDLKFLEPVRPDDVLTGSITVKEFKPESSLNRALVVYAGELSNQHGRRVMVLTMSIYVKISA